MKGCYNFILETAGNNLVSIMEGKDIQKNNYNSISAGEPLCIDNLGLHILARDHRFDLKTRKVL